MYSQKDLDLIKKKGLSSEAVQKQIDNYKNGFPFAKMIKSAVVGDGILAVENKEDIISYYDEVCADHDIVRFIPASGAATRMFKEFFSYVADTGMDDEKLSKDDYKVVRTFFDGLSKFAFAGKLNDLIDGIDKASNNDIINAMLNKNGLDYGAKPKGLILFHNYKDKPRTAAEEHVMDLTYYKEEKARFHFTVSAEHRQEFELHLEEVAKYMKADYDIEVSFTFSVQNPNTDIIAVDLKNNPVKIDDELFFRPGGHGALLDNLNNLDAEIVYIKNIDNTVTDREKQLLADERRILAGVLLQYQQQIYAYLTELEQKGEAIDNSTLDEMISFMVSKVYVDSKVFDVSTKKEKLEALYKKLNRPIRTCSMVINEGEPGGGPFFVQSIDGEVSLQVVEGPSVNTNDEEQKQLYASSTHFNPTDIVCCIKDYKGNKFDLFEFRDSSAGFITEKSVQGIDIKAQELPGLWNGSMSDWNTIFVEIPVATFNPVKSVIDLIKPRHLV